MNAAGFTAEPKVRVTRMGEALVAAATAKVGDGWVSEKFWVKKAEAGLVLPAASVTESTGRDNSKTVDP